MSELLHFPCAMDEAAVRALARGELVGEKAASLEAHVASCPSCEALAATEALRPALVAAFRGRPPASVTAGFTDAVMGAVEREERKRDERRALPRAAAVMGLALLAAAGLVLRGRPAPVPVAVQAKAPPPAAVPVVAFPGEVTLHMPVAELFVDAEAQVVFVVLPEGEAL